jgi:putative zinc finger/helix-turn-helix YgiT family protein
MREIPAMNENANSHEAGSIVECPSCDGMDVKTEWEEKTFQYDSGGGNLIDVTATIPRRVCRTCGFTFTDEEAEDAEHDAVCRHLGVMTPREVLGIRKRHDLTQAEFSRLTKLGEATVSRWERGALIQNGANDQLLYLLRFPENVELLRTRRTSRAANRAATPQFRCLQPSHAMRAEAEAFQLRKALPNHSD